VSEAVVTALPQKPVTAASPLRDSDAQRISIDEGAYLKGRVNIQKEAPKKEVSAVTASASK